MDEKAVVKLVSKEGEVHEVPLAIAKMSTLVATTIDDDEDNKRDREISLPYIKNSVLIKVIEYCTYYQTVEAMTQINLPVKASKIEDLVQPWYAEFIRVDRPLVCELVTAANYMKIQPLVNLGCTKTAYMLKEMSPSEMRAIFNIRNEFSPEEE